MQEKSNGSPERRDQQAGNHQAVGKGQVSGGFRAVPSEVRLMIQTIEFP